MSFLVDIALPVPLDKLFTYSVPIAEDTEAKLSYVGRRALVPLGKRSITGVITGISEGIKDAKTRDIIEILDIEPVFTSKMIELCRWISEYYIVPLGEVFKAAIPQGLSPKSVLKVSINRSIPDEELIRLNRNAPRRMELLKALSKRTGNITLAYLNQELKSENLLPQIEALQKLGAIHIERVMDKQVGKKILKGVGLSEELIADKAKLEEALTELDQKAHKQAIVLSHVYLYGKEESNKLTVASIIKATGCNNEAISALIRKGYLKAINIEIIRGKFVLEDESLADRDESLLELTGEQRVCAEAIVTDFAAEIKKPLLLHGITGSGKTLVYISVIKEVLKAGKNALILVPEISLTPQLIDRFGRVFGDIVSVLHSRMSEGERYDSWRQALEGKARLLLGARSAIFAPIRNLGMIIVDEEHDQSYKQDGTIPYYQARDCAVVRAKMEGATVVLGSATPSLESMYNAMSGKYTYLQIQNRADGAILPEIKTIDLRDEYRKGNRSGNYSAEMLKSITLRVAKKEGTILLQNRRGFSVYLECPDCGDIPACKNCSVSLTWHKKSNNLVCHYCGYTIQRQRICQICGGGDVRELGTGTQKIEDEIAEKLQEFGIEPLIRRLDLDTASARGAHRRILQEFALGRTDILVGTQMVAKGLDFKRVSFVGVINADLSLYSQDFRASERTFQLLTQVAGRSGRTKESKGEVIIQTRHPEHPAIRAAQKHDYLSFYESELLEREKASYPPFARIIKIEFTGKSNEKVNLQCARFFGILPQRTDFMTILGPVQPLVFKIRNEYRKMIIIKSLRDKDPTLRRTRDILKKVMERYLKDFSESGVSISLDVDSYSNA
jgi:primosomal protein N' (replication factor Y)